jgi:hypothetical protein
MLDDIKHQVNQLRGNNEADLSRMETRIMMRIEDGMRSNDKIVSVANKLLLILLELILSFLKTKLTDWHRPSHRGVNFEHEQANHSFRGGVQPRAAPSGKHGRCKITKTHET